MDSLLPTDRTEIHGFDMSNYFRDPNSYNPIIYIHKRNLREMKNKKIKNFSNKHDQFQQYDCDKVHECDEVDVNNKYNEDPILGHTIQFAKELIPLSIPAETNNDSVYYTLKTSKKIKRKHESCKHTCAKDVTFVKEKSKRKNEKCKHLKSEHLSTTETTNPSSQSNTLDDINENRSLSYSLSEISDRKNVKREKDKKNDDQKFIASESLEPFATDGKDNTTSKAAIKIHVLNDNEKHNLIENIRIPVIEAVKESIFETNNHKEVLTQLHCVQNTVYNNSLILENILNKLSNIEKKLENYTQEKNTTTTDESNYVKTSKLEELGEDLIVKEELSSEEELVHVNLHKKRDNRTIVTPIHMRNEVEKEIDNLGRGDKISVQYKASTSQMGMRTDQPNRMPARFCWADTNIN